jgi:hypothetical protein
MSLSDSDKAKLERIALERKRREGIVDGSPDAKVIELAKLQPLDYGKIRKEEAKKLGIGVKALDDAVKEQQKGKKEQANFLPHWNNEPWPDPIAGDSLLDELRAHRCQRGKGRRSSSGYQSGIRLHRQGCVHDQNAARQSPMR